MTSQCAYCAHCLRRWPLLRACIEFLFARQLRATLKRSFPGKVIAFPSRTDATFVNFAVGIVTLAEAINVPVKEK